MFSRFCFPLPLLAIAVACLSANTDIARGADAAEACAVVIGTNDSHGQLLPRVPDWAEGREVGGVAALAAYFERVRARSGSCPVFIFSAGDMMQGTLISNLVDGLSTIEAFNALGYDAAAIGNHEFDWGIDILRQRIDDADFTFLGANIFEKDTGAHPDWVVPYTIIERAGVRVGVVGAITRSTPLTTLPANVASLSFGSIAEALDRYIPEVRQHGVDFVVVLLHAGGSCSTSDSCSGEAITALSGTSARFDYVITGHVHKTPLRTRLRGAPVVQGLPHTLAFTVGRLQRDPSGQVTGRLADVVVPYTAEAEPDSTLADLVARYEALVIEEARRPIASLAAPLQRVGSQFALGSLIADAQRAATGTQVAIVNNGGIRRALAAGGVTYGDLFEAQPFQDTLIRLRLSGAVLLRALEHGLSTSRPDVHVSGVRVEYDPAAPPGARVVAAILVNGERVDSAASYTVVVNSFMATGGDGFDMFDEAEETEDTGIIDLEALVAYLRGLPQPIVALRDLRFIAVFADSGPPQAIRATRRCIIARVVDGDTIECKRLGRVRLIGMDTPELSQSPFGSLAADALARLTPVGSAVLLEPDVEPRDRYGRLLAYVWADGRMVNWTLLRSGWAVLLTYPPNVQYVDSFTAAQRRARAERQGLWARGGFECQPIERRRGRC